MTGKLTGRALDERVAEKVMGLEVWPPTRGQQQPPMVGNGDKIESWLPEYSKDMSAAWQVVEKMRQDGWVLMYVENMCASTCVAASFQRDPAIDDYDIEVDARAGCGDGTEPESGAEAAARAICRAALAALERLEVEDPR